MLLLSTLNWTPATVPELSEASAERVIMAFTIELFAGEVMLTRGGVVSEAVLTVTVMAEEVIDAPPLSVALAVKV